jgi:mercuric ion transport protein
MKSKTPSATEKSSAQAAAAPALLAAGAGALLASACCLGPLILVLAGVSGAWIGRLPGLGPYQPAFLAAAVIAMTIAGRRIWRAPACAEDRVCAAPAGKRAQKIIFFAIAGLLALVLGFPLVAHYFY